MSEIVYNVLRCCCLPRSQQLTCEYDVIITDRNDGQNCKAMLHLFHIVQTVILSSQVEKQNSHFFHSCTSVSGVLGNLDSYDKIKNKKRTTGVSISWWQND